MGQKNGVGGMGPLNFGVGQKNGVGGVGRNFGVGGVGPENLRGSKFWHRSRK